MCPVDGYFRDPDRCDVYYLCADGNSIRMTCATGTSFDVTLNMCMWSHLVTGCEQEDQYKDDYQDLHYLTPTDSTDSVWEKDDDVQNTKENSYSGI